MIDPIIQMIGCGVVGGFTAAGCMFLLAVMSSS